MTADNITEKLSTLTNVYDRLLMTEKHIADAGKWIDAEFAEPEGRARFLNNPITYQVSVDDAIEKAQRGFTDFVVKQLDRDYKNLSIDRDEMRQYTKDNGFNAADLIKHITDKYADEDDMTLRQIKAVTTELIPHRSGWQHGKQTIDELEPIGDTGFVLHIYGYAYDMDCETSGKVSTFLKLVDITLRGIRPSEVETRTVEIGKPYKDDKVKSLRYFKNNALKVVFHTVDDCEKVKAALFTE